MNFRAKFDKLFRKSFVYSKNLLLYCDNAIRQRMKVWRHKLILGAFCKENKQYLTKLGVLFVIILLGIVGRSTCHFISSGEGAYSINGLKNALSTDRRFIIALSLSFLGFSVATMSQLYMTNGINRKITLSVLFLLALYILFMSLNIQCIGEQPSILVFHLAHLNYFFGSLLLFLLLPLIFQTRTAITKSKLIRI